MGCCQLMRRPAVVSQEECRVLFSALVPAMGRSITLIVFLFACSAAYMELYCPYSCDICSDVVVSDTTCYDQDADCAWFLEQGYCEDPR